MNLVIKNKTPGPLPKIDEHEAGIIRNLRKKGLTYYQIAAKMNRTYYEVWRVINYRKPRSNGSYFE